MKEVQIRKRIAKRIRMVREYCLEWDIETTAKQLGVNSDKIRDFEKDKECCSCGYFIALCDNAGVCPDSLIHLSDKENPQGLMRWSFEHYIFKLGYTGIDKNNEFKDFKEPKTLEILNIQDYKERGDFTPLEC